MTSAIDEEIQREIDDISNFYTHLSDEEDISWIDQLNLNDSTKNQTGIHDTSGDASITIINALDDSTKLNWLYPVQGYEKRDYQFNISKTTLFHNTLVILPTGLGKTFIASVTIYNFMRWFPQSKIVFMAPTRPLVNQQMSACYDIVGIPKNETAEMTGKTSNKKKRKVEWESKRIFFATPQVIQSDIKEGIFPTHSIRLLVFDEAHKAKGDYAYCKVVQEISRVNRNFRILGLTATAGKSADVIQIIQNLLISKIEHRSENSLDVSRYTHKKMINIIPVKLGADLQAISDKFMQAVDPIITELKRAGAFQTNQISKGYLLMQRKSLLDNRSIPHNQKSEVLANYSAAIGFYHSLEILQRHSVHLFLKSLRDDENKTNYKFFIARNYNLLNYVKELESKYESMSPFRVNVSSLRDDNIPLNIEVDFGHPKFQILAAKLKEYFENNGTKAIIFCEYRDTTQIIEILLMKLRPLVKATVLVGQGLSISQKKQLQIMKDFREGKKNTLICTCVAEEGLDVGDVDLVICFDVNTKNSVRFVQRIGRTARKRKGQVIVLATEGKELSISRDLIYSKDQMNKSITRNNDISKYLFKGPKLFPKDFNPQCIELKFVFNKNEEEQSEDENDKKSKNKRKVSKKAAKNLEPKKSKGTITNYLKPIKSKTSDIEPKNEVQIIQEMEPNVISLNDELASTDINRNVVVDEYIESVKKIKEQNCIMAGSYISNYIDDYTNKEIEKISNLIETLSMPTVGKFENFVVSPEKIDLSLLKTSKCQSRIQIKCDSILSDLNHSIDLFKSPIKKDEVLNQKKTPALNSPFGFNFSSLQNSSTPIRRDVSTKKDNSALKKSLSHFHTSKLTDGNVSISQPAVKNKFDFLGIASIEDIFEGCDSHFDYNNTTKFTENIQKSPLSRNETVKCSAETQSKQNLFRDLNISDINDIFEMTGEIEVPEKITNEKYEEYDDDLTQIYDIEAKVAKIEKINMSTKSDPCNEEFSKTKQSSSSSDKTVNYDVEEALSKLEESFGNSQKENLNVQVEKKFSSSSTSSSVSKPDLSKLISFMQNAGTSSSKNTLEKTVINEIEETQQIEERCLTPTNQKTKIKSNESTPDLQLPAIKSQGLHDFPCSPISSRIRKELDLEFRKPLKPKIRRNQRAHNLFLQTQAGVDDLGSTDEEECDENVSSFICNESNLHDETSMFAKYVKSLNSPSAPRNRNFVMRQLNCANISDVYSQFPQNEDEMYDDSDSVNSFIADDSECLEVASEIDDLDLVEQALKKNKKRKLKQENSERKKKRKIIIEDSSSSDDEEFVKLRNEILANPD